MEAAENKPVNPHENFVKAGEPYRFSSSKQPRNRRKNRLASEAKKNGLSKDELITGIKELMKMNFDQLNEIAKDTKQPTYRIIIANALIGDLSRKNLVNTNSVADRVFGTPTQKIESKNTNKDEVRLPPLTEKALLKLAGLDEEIG